MKGFIKNERGVSLISLAAAIIILGIITSMLIYNIKDTKDMERLTNMYTDIENITDRISNYYSKYGALPIKNEIDLSSDPTITRWKTDKSENKGPLGANDSDTFYVINLNALENLTLNYGKGFYNIENSVPADKDIYVINENSHNIYYLNGIKVRGNSETKIYYTNLDRDTEKVILNYFDGIRIPEGFTFKSGSTKDDLKVENSSNVEFSWANTKDGNMSLSISGNDILLTRTGNSSYEIELTEEQSKENLLKSDKEFGGFYYTIKGGSVINVNYLSIEEDNNWGPTFDSEGIYKDVNGDKAYIPAGFKISRLSTLNTIKNGLVIKNNSTGDEYVWIDVPDSVLANTKTLEEAQNGLIDYTKEYRTSSYEDKWIDGCITMTSDPTQNSNTVYNQMRNEMYQSIKVNGGFWMSRDENTDSDKTCIKALANARNTNITNKKCGLLFGVQWDLACKFISGSDNDKNIKNFSSNCKEWTLEFNGTKCVLRNGTQRESKATTDSLGNDIGYRVMIY